jgi:hypothetical protein
MAHMYAKDPPRFAKDPWAWDYTRDRLEANTGIPYDQWEGKHFAGAAAMYKNVVNKYGDSITQGKLTPPHVCVDCGQSAQHYLNDYVCVNCRGAIENAPTYAAAAATITTPDALDTIREQLYKSLGHDKKDAKVGRTAPAPTPMPARSVSPTNTLAEPQPVPEAPPGTVSRNYASMKDDKLRRSLRELQEGQGEAVEKARAKAENTDDHWAAAMKVARERGLF